jgi:hypothetical protein
MYDSVAIGTKTGSNSIGILNVHIGSNAGNSNLADDTVFIGANAGRWNSGHYSIGIGHAAFCAGQDSNCIAIGHAALGSNGSCISNGDYRPYNIASNCIAIGDRAAENNGTSSDAYNLIAIGDGAGYSNQSHHSIYLGSNPNGSNNATPFWNYANKFLVYATNTCNDGIATYTDLNSRWLGIACVPDRALSVNGNAISYAWDLYSDRRMKQDIVVTTLGLDFVKSLKPVDYKLTEKPDVLRHGLIAQDVQEVAPEMVSVSSTDGKLSLSYMEVIAPLVKAVQELSAEVDDLKAKVARLQA